MSLDIQQRVWDGFLRHRVRELLARLNESWPWKDRPWPVADRAAIQEARNRIARGQGENLTTILDRVQVGGALVQE